ncbi:hypothetical protein [Grimontia sp. NTOU-MAR1]|uniref:hypothetical protein n=1 Tax=Grimontia sp. NTOU-MAR1 TaxID=3111011 RepID=UPI002DBE3CE7|nr:hypothetical protein [Grimontia sp. NTOU-MAR1]WRV99330.1 hypothetical protein VP504_08010 [Grimontia sp. NTOU-MAR1]
MSGLGSLKFGALHGQRQSTFRVGRTPYGILPGVCLSHRASSFLHVGAGLMSHLSAVCETVVKLMKDYF